jgi:uncharacterized protein (UPF0548 family)
MISLTKPSEFQIRAFLSRWRGCPYSYPDVGASLDKPPDGYVLDHRRVRLGEGPQVFDRACAALRGWAMSRVGWVEIWPPEAPLEEGTTVAVVARGLGLWSVFACRVVRVIAEYGPIEAFGFAYGTLPGHVLSGEERFLVRWDRREGSVWYDLLAFSRPAHLVGRLGYPLVRRVQRRFAPDSLRAMARAVEGEKG